MKGRWTPHDLRDQVVDFVVDLSLKTRISQRSLIGWIGISPSKFYSWRTRYGQVNEHNGKIPRDHWLEEWEIQEILDFQTRNPLEGYRRLCFMMIDADLVAASPSTVYRVLSKANRLDRWNKKTSPKGKGFTQPTRPHEHWHSDISYLNLGGTFFYLISVLDGYSRYVVHWEIRESMKERDVEIVIQRALEKYPGERPRVISDNGSAYTARDFKSFIRLTGMTHVRTSPSYPQSNGKIERWHRTLKSNAIRRFEPSTVEEAKGVVERYVDHYNNTRLHSSIGYVTPADMLAGRENEIWKTRDQRLEKARELRRQNRVKSRQEFQDSKVADLYQIQNNA